MDNANSNEYLEKIKIQVIENLKKTAHAPSVQMTEIPRTTMLGGTEEDDDILDDLDEDENKDTRNTKRRWDQNVERDDEFEESDDEEMAEANGIHPQNGKAKRRNISDFTNANAAASDIEMDSGIASPQISQEVDEEVAASVAEANAEVNAEIMDSKTGTLGVNVEVNEVGPSNAPSRSDSPKPTAIDTEGDIEMADENPAEPSVAPTAPAPPALESLISHSTDDAKAVAKEEGETERAAVEVEGEVAKEVAEGHA